MRDSDSDLYNISWMMQITIWSEKPGIGTHLGNGSARSSKGVELGGRVLGIVGRFLGHFIRVDFPPATMSGVGAIRKVPRI